MSCGQLFFSFGHCYDSQRCHHYCLSNPDRVFCCVLQTTCAALHCQSTPRLPDPTTATCSSGSRQRAARGSKSSRRWSECRIAAPQLAVRECVGSPEQQFVRRLLNSEVLLMHCGEKRDYEPVCIVGCGWESATPSRMGSTGKQGAKKLIANPLVLQVGQIERLPALLVSRQKQGQLHPPRLSLLPCQAPVPVSPSLCLTFARLAARRWPNAASGDPGSAQYAATERQPGKGRRRQQRQH